MLDILYISMQKEEKWPNHGSNNPKSKLNKKVLFKS